MNNQDTFVQLLFEATSKSGVAIGLTLSASRKQERSLVLRRRRFLQKNVWLHRPASGGNNSLGTVGDVSVDYNVASKTNFTFYFGGVTGGRVQDYVYPGSSARFMYFELLQRF